MSREPRQRGRRWLVVAIGCALVLVVAAVVVRSLVLRDDARALSTDDALGRYRTAVSTAQPVDTPSTAGSTAQGSAVTVAAVSVVATSGASSTTSTVAPAIVRTLPEPGVYRYRTTGVEGIDVLGGTEHPYPQETTITIVPGGCGVSLRWDALKERWDQWQLCSTADGIELGTDGIQYHEFFGQGESEPVRCDVRVLLVPNALDRSDPVQQSCLLADDPWLPTWEVLERTVRTVAGEQIEVQHVRMTIDDNDDYWEHLVVDWYLTDSGLPIDVTTTKSSRSPSQVGAVVYREEYHLEIVSLTPLQ